MASYAGLKKAGNGLLDYMMKHRPEVDEDMSAGLHDLGEMFPGIYEYGAKRYSTGVSADVDREAMIPIKAVRGIPDAEVDIFRAVPQGVRDFNVGDWVTTSKSYAKEHGAHSLNNEYDIITGKAKASDLFNPGDSIAEMGYWGLPMAGKVTRGLIPAVGAGGMLALLGAEDAEAAGPHKWNARGVKEVVDQLNAKDFKGGLLDVLSEKDLAEIAKRDWAFTEPQYSIDGEGVKHLHISRTVKPKKQRDKKTPEQVGDMLNSLMTNTRRRFVTTKGDHPAGVVVPRSGRSYLGVFEPQEGKVGFYTAFDTKTKDLPKQMGRSVEVEGGDPHLAISPGGDLPTQRSLPAVTSGGNISEDSKLSKAIIPLTVGGVLVPRTAEASIPGEDYVFPAQRPGYVTPDYIDDKPLESPLVDPADLITAPFGVVGAGAKAASVVAEPAIAYGMNKLMGLIVKLWED